MGMRSLNGESDRKGKMKEKLRLAVFGHKRWSREGGVEIVVKELCTRMAQQGCQVTCYNRAGHHVSGAEYDDAGKTEYEGIRQKSVPTIERRGARDIIRGCHNRDKGTAENDMYPLYWTPSRGGIIMRYTYEYKRKCVELYREGKWPETPEGVSDKSFRDKVRLWVRAEDSRGPEALKHKNFNRNWTPEERLELVSQVMSGKSCVSVAIEAGIQDRLLYQWVQNYKTKGYNGLVEMKKGRPSKGVPQMKKEEARPLNESEREELIRLRAENEYIKAENEVIKKEIALREERHAAQLKARKQRSSKSCVKKDTN